MKPSPIAFYSPISKAIKTIRSQLYTTSSILDGKVLDIIKIGLSERGLKIMKLEVTTWLLEFLSFFLKLHLIPVERGYPGCSARYTLGIERLHTGIDTEK